MPLKSYREARKGVLTVSQVVFFFLQRPHAEMQEEGQQDEHENSHRSEDGQDGGVERGICNRNCNETDLIEIKKSCAQTIAKAKAALSRKLENSFSR